MADGGKEQDETAQRMPDADHRPVIMLAQIGNGLLDQMRPTVGHRIAWIVADAVKVADVAALFAQRLVQFAVHRRRKAVGVGKMNDGGHGRRSSCPIVYQAFAWQNMDGAFSHGRTVATTNQGTAVLAVTRS
ncbi:hypothetical protein D3C72_1952760 [compost metagenome]